MMNYEEKRILGLHRLSFQVILGFYPEERAKKQLVEISFRYEVARPVQDDVKESVCYAVLAKEISAMVEASSFNLVETMAEQVMEILWKQPKILWAEVTVTKPHAPVSGAAGGSSVVLERRRV